MCESREQPTTTAPSSTRPTSLTRVMRPLSPVFTMMSQGQLDSRGWNSSGATFATVAGALGAINTFTENPALVDGQLGVRLVQTRDKIFH